MQSGRLLVLAVSSGLCVIFTMAIMASDRQAGTNGETAPIVDVPPAGTIVSYTPTTNFRDPSDRYVPVRFADPDRVKPVGERRFNETPEEQAVRLGLPCQNLVYRNSCPSGCFIFL